MEHKWMGEGEKEFIAVEHLLWKRHFSSHLMFVITPHFTSCPFFSTWNNYKLKLNNLSEVTSYKHAQIKGSVTLSPYCFYKTRQIFRRKPGKSLEGIQYFITEVWLMLASRRGKIGIFPKSWPLPNFYTNNLLICIGKIKFVNNFIHQFSNVGFFSVIHTAF